MKRLTHFTYSELANHRRQKFLKAIHETLDRLTKLQKVENINIKIERLRRK